MLIKVALTEDIINQCLTLHYHYNPVGRKSKQKLIYIPLVLLIISVYLIYTELRQPVLGQNFFLALLYIAFAIAYYFFMRKRMVKGGKQLLKNLDENAFFEMEVDEEKLTTFTLTSTLDTPWSSLTAALVSKENVLLYQSDNSFTMFNHSFFQQNDFNLFKSWVRQKVAPLTETEMA